MRTLVLIGTWIAFLAWGTVLYYGQQAAATRASWCAARMTLAPNHRVVPEDVVCGQAAAGMFVYGRYAAGEIAANAPVTPSRTLSAPAVNLDADETLFSPARTGAVPRQIDAGSRGQILVQQGQPIRARIVAILCDPGERCAPLIAVPAADMKPIAAAPAGALRLAVNNIEYPIGTSAEPPASAVAPRPPKPSKDPRPLAR